jgi:hypothetical protein
MNILKHITLKSISLNKWLFNPFIYVSGGRALAIGWIIMLITAFVAYLGNIHFDGAIDLHIGAKTSPVVYLMEPLIDWLIVSLCFYSAALILSKSRIRIIDFLGTVALARATFLPAVLIGLSPPLQQLSLENMTAAGLIFSLVLLLPVIWHVVLLYNGFTLSANLKQRKADYGFIISLLVGEVISKTALHYVILNLLK